jgi:hypothetical protein
MPKPSIFPPGPEPRKGPKKIPPTPEQVAKVVTAKLKSPAGLPDKAELALRVVLPRPVIERLMARAHRENYPSLAAWVQAVRALARSSICGLSAEPHHPGRGGMSRSTSRSSRSCWARGGRFPRGRMMR